MRGGAAARRCGLARRYVGPAVLLVLLAGCGSISGGSGVNGGVIPISEAGTYHYVMTVPVVPAGYYGPDLLRLSSDTDSVVMLTPTGNSGSGSGSVYLSAGNWTGEAGYVSPTAGDAAPVCGGGVPVPQSDGSWFCSESTDTWSLTLTS